MLYLYIRLYNFYGDPNNLVGSAKLAAMEISVNTLDNPDYLKKPLGRRIFYTTHVYMSNLLHCCRSYFLNAKGMLLSDHCLHSCQAAMMCTSAGWWQLEALYSALSVQAAAGARPELLPLMKVNLIVYAGSQLCK